MRRIVPTTATTPVTIERAADGGYVVHALTTSGVVSLGTHSRVADAWRAIDALDAPADFAQAA